MSKQPRTQRKAAREASLHERQKQVHATLDSELRAEYDTRRVRVNAGDTVEVMRGDHAGETGEVLDVDLRSETIEVENVTVEKADEEETARRLDASNVRVTDLDLEDDRRETRLEENDE